MVCGNGVEECVLADAVAGEGKIAGGDGDVRMGFCGEGVDDGVGAATAAGKGPIEVAVLARGCFQVCTRRSDDFPF